MKRGGWTGRRREGERMDRREKVESREVRIIEMGKRGGRRRARQQGWRRGVGRQAWRKEGRRELTK